MSLELYIDNGFKLFLCRPDKSPDIPKGESWQDEKWHIDLEKATTLQNTGHMIGAWIPEDIIVIDLDRHEGKKDGLESFKKVKEILNLDISFVDDTATVRTAGNGFHVFFNVGENHGIKQGEIIIKKEKTGIDIKTNSGYVIASGSPGYETLCDYEPMLCPDVLKDYLYENRTQNKKVKKTNSRPVENKKLLKPKLLKSILTKVPVENFRSNDRWQEFITSAIATTGQSEEVAEILENWSNSDPNYSGDRSILNRIESFNSEGGITTGSFIMFLREENVTPYMINQVVKLDSITATITEGEQSESELPFKEPDYYELSESKYVKEFFVTCGNSAAKNILFEAFNGNVLHVKGEKENYFFNGSRWEVLKDYYSIVYTILFRVAKIYYAKCDDGKENQDRMMKVVNSINDTTWKSKTITEINAMIREDQVKWDSPTIRETVTTIDGVIDFSNNIIEKRQGFRGEFRLKHVNYTTDEILNAEHPNFYCSFMQEVFPDFETYKMAMQLVSLCITGNAEKRIFQLWEGDGANGKSTLIDIIKHVLTGKTNTYDPKLLMPDKYGSKMGVTPELYSFRGSYAAVGTEVDQSGEFSMGVIKNLTGDDTITANPKYKDQVEFDATWQLILAVNDLPRFSGTDSAFIDRLYIVPFVMTFPKTENEIENLLNKGVLPEKIGKRKNKTKMMKNILSQKAGIIKSMINEYLELQNEYDGIITESEQSKNKKAFYIQDNDDLGNFLENMCEIEPDSFCSSEEITEAFKDYMGLKKASSKWIISNLKKHYKTIKSDTRMVLVEKPTGGYEKKRRRGLSGVSIKQAEFVASMEEMNV